MNQQTCSFSESLDKLQQALFLSLLHVLLAAQAQASCAACVPLCWALAMSAYVLEESPPGYKAR